MKDDDVIVRLDKLIKLLAIVVTRELSQKEQVSVLAKAGFAPKDIADLIGTTPNTVSVTLSSLKRQSQSKGGSSAGEKK